MEKEPYGNGGECYRGNEKKIIFYNMKCKDVLDEKLPSWTKMKSHDMNRDGM
jgi:hypothetical protein